MASDALPVIVKGAQSVELFSKQSPNRIGVTAWTAAHLGYLDKDKTQLQVVGTITEQDPIAMHAFTFRKGTQISLLSNSNAGTRIQLMDSNGRQIFADNGGTDTSLKEAFVDLLNGHTELKNGNYVLKVMHDTDKVSKKTTLNYDIKLNSGTTYYSRYKTLAGAETVLQHLQETGAIGYNANGVTASMLNTQASGGEINIFDYYA